MSIQEIKALRDSEAEIYAEAQKVLESTTDDAPEELAAQNEARFDDMMVEHDKKMAKAERLQKLQAAHKRLNEGVYGNPESGSDKEAKAPEEKRSEYRDAFHAMLASGGDLSLLDSEQRNVLRKGATEFRAQNVGTDAAGGFTVPVELQNILIETMKMHGPMYDGSFITEIVTSGGNKLQMPTVDDTDNSASPRAENAAIVDDASGDVVFGRRELDAFVRATPFVKFSMELTQDSIFNIENLLNQLLGKRLGRAANAELTNGAGTAGPNGIVTASDAGITAAGTTAVTSDEIIDLFHSVDPAYRSAGQSLAYMMNDQTLAAIRKLKDGQGNYLWQQGNIVQGVPQTLNGVRVVINQDMPSLAATNKAILFGDFSQYYVRKVGAPVLGVMKERFWPDLGIAGLIRFDGEIADLAAIKALQMGA